MTHLIDSLNDIQHSEQRFQEIAERHHRALSWEPQDWIPLGIIVSNPEYAHGLTYDKWLDPAPFFEVQARILLDTLAVGSDTLPVLPLNHLGDVLIPTMFGAELFVPQEMADSLQDTGATPLPVLDSIAQVDELEMPEISDGLMPDFAEIVRKWRTWAPNWVSIITPFPVGPFSLAAELRGSNLFIDVIDDPQRCHHLMDLCAHMLIRTEKYLASLARNPTSLPLSNFGVRSLGRRIGDDTIINLSPAQTKAFAVPHLETIARKLGPATVHFCTLAERRADQLFTPLAQSPLISTASTQFGFEYYAAHVEELRGQLSIEAFYGDAHDYVCEMTGSFRDWAFEFVPKFKNQSGLVLFFQVPDVDTGREYWETWKEAHQRQPRPKYAREESGDV